MLVPSSARSSEIHTNSKALSRLRHLVVYCNRHISQLSFCAPVIEEYWTKTYLGRTFSIKTTFVYFPLAFPVKKSIDKSIL